MAGSDNEVRMMMSVYPGAMTGFAALNSGLVSINNVFASMTRSVDAQFGLINTAIMTTGVVATQFATDCMNAYGQFEQGMKIVQMVSGQTAEDIKYLKQQANDLSVSFRTDIDQITEGLQTLGRAGLNSASEQVEVLENGLSTAKLEGRDLNGVLEELIQNTALLGGSLKSSEFGEDSQYINDLLVATSMTAPITTHDVSETLKYSGGIAAAAGATIRDDEGGVDENGKRILEDYMGAIAAFAQKGVTGSIAGTALRAFFNKPATQDSSVTEALATIQLKPEYLWEDDEETMKPVSEQIGLIQKQMDKLNISTMDRLQIWSKIVGGKMGQQMMKLDSEDIKELTSDIRKADDATSLAQGSMKTYEANIKAIGEAGERFKRNIGEDLVYLANPILTVIAKIAGFLNNDIMSWPFTAGILALITAAARRIKGVFSSIRAEISELLTAYRAGMNYFTQKGGVVRKGDNPLDDEKKAEFYQQHGLGKYGGKKSESSGDKKLEESKLSSAKTLADYDKIIKKQMTESGPFTLASMKKAGLSDIELGMAGRLGNLRKDSLGKGITDGTLLQAGLRFNAFTDKEMEKLTTAYRGGANPRPMANMIDLESLFTRLIKNDEAVKALGLTIEKESAVTKDAQLAHQQRLSSEMDSIAEEKIRREEEIKAAQAAAEARIAAEKEAERQIAQSAAQAASHATALGDEVKVTSERIVMDVKLALGEVGMVFTEFFNLMKGISAFNAVPVGKGSSGGPVVGGYIPLPSNIHDMMGKPYVPNQVIEDRARELNEQARDARIRSLSQKDTDMRAKAFEQAYKNPYIPPKEDPSARTQNKIDSELRGNRLKNDFKEYNDAQAAHFNRLVEKGNHIEKAYKEAVETRSKYIGAAGVGSIAGQLPTKEQLDESIKAYKEKDAETRRDFRNQSITRGSMSNEVSGMGRLGVGLTRNDIEDIKKDSDSLYRRNFRNRSVDRGSMSQDVSGMARHGVGLTRDSINRIKDGVSQVFHRNQFLTRGTGEDISGMGKFGVGLTRQGADEIKNGPSSNDMLNDKYGYPTNMRTSSSSQVTPHFSTITSYKDWYLQTIGKEGEVQDKQREKVLKQAKEPKSTEEAYKQYYEETIGKDMGIHEKEMNKILNSKEVQESSHPYVSSPIGSIPTYREKISSAISSFKQSSYMHPIAALQQTGLYQNFVGRINRDRTGNFVSFGKEIDKTTGQLRSATTGLKGMGNKFLNLTDLIGGPVMLAFMVIPQLIEMWKGAFEDFCKSLKEAEDQVADAYSNMQSAEDELRKTYEDYNPEATADEIDQMIYDTYSTMADDMNKAVKENDKAYFEKLNLDAAKEKELEYDEEKDDGSLKEKEEEEKSTDEAYEEAIKQNTGALYQATAQLNVAVSKLSNKMTDSWWGLDSWTTWLTDQWGGFWDKAFNQDEFYGNGQGASGGKTFTENDHDFLLTQSQADENYSGYTEMAGLMLEDIKDANGNWIKGMRTMMGKDVELLNSMLPQSGRDWMKKLSSKESDGIGNLSPRSNAKLQTSMKNDPKTWKKIAREYAKMDVNKKQGKSTEKNVNRIKGLSQKLLQEVGSGFKSNHIMQAAYLVQMQEMYKVAQNTMVPLIDQNTQLAGSQLLQQAGIHSTTSNTASNAGGTWGTAQVISGLVAIIAKTKAAEYAHQTAQEADPNSTDLNGDGYDETDKAVIELAQSTSDYKDFQREANKRYYKGRDNVINPNQAEIDKAPALFIAQMYGAGAKMTGYDYDAKTANETMQKWLREDLTGKESLSDIYGTLGKNYTENERFQQRLIDNYIAADNDDGEGNGSDGGGGGGGGGGDSKDKDNTGTKKERVDLVLCNKKEIPKLNVNLFKKPPSFTILNKNFKLRDLKINTEDKPKAIMSSIKNAFIDVQKRSDPKIIQDEEAEYDPVAATDGNATPSGSAKTKTDSKTSSN